jgi:hypothetical protein
MSVAARGADKHLFPHNCRVAYRYDLTRSTVTCDVVRRQKKTDASNVPEGGGLVVRRYHTSYILLLEITYYSILYVLLHFVSPRRVVLGSFWPPVCSLSRAMARSSRPFWGFGSQVVDFGVVELTVAYSYSELGVATQSAGVPTRTSGSSSQKGEVCGLVLVRPAHTTVRRTL